MKNICVNVSEMGLNPEKLCEMIETLEKEVELHSIVVQYDGKKIIEGAWDPFTLEDPQMTHSLSKIGTAICIGYAIDEGKLRLDDKLLDYVRGELPEEYDSALEELTVGRIPRML